MRKIRAIIKRPDEKGHVSFIGDSLENLQRTVDGYIEAVTIMSDVVVICNEEGRLNGLDPNCRIAGYDFVGTIALLGVAGDEFADLPESISLKWFKEHMCEPYGGGSNG